MTGTESLLYARPQIEARIAEQSMMVRAISRSFREGKGAEWSDVDTARRSLDALLDEYEEAMKHEPH